MAISWSRVLLGVLLPRSCVSCRRDLPYAEDDSPLCRACLARLNPDERRRRAGGGLEVCSAFAYASPVPELLHAFKYRGSRLSGRFLAEEMARPAARRPFGGLEAVVPVPLHPARLRRRGFNQASILAEAVAGAVGAPVVDLLERVRDTAPQWRLGRGERARNLREAFRARAPADARSSRRPPPRILLVDDVCTTGATLEGCAEALRRAGWAEVSAYVLARD